MGRERGGGGGASTSCPNERFFIEEGEVAELGEVDVTTHTLVIAGSGGVVVVVVVMVVMMMLM